MQSEASPLVSVDVEIGDDVILRRVARAFGMVTLGYEVEAGRSTCLPQTAVLLAVMENKDAISQLVDDELPVFLDVHFVKFFH